MDFFSEKWRESNDYRAAFFRKNRGFMGKIWLCSQCYKPLWEKHNVEVDHIVAPSRLLIGKQKNNIFATLMNTEMNTVPICSDCNKTKGNKLGFFVVKGWVARLFTVVFHRAQDALVLLVYLILLILHKIISMFTKIAKKGSKAGYKKVSKMKYGKLAMGIVVVVAALYLASKYLK